MGTLTMWIIPSINDILLRLDSLYLNNILDIYFYDTLLRNWEQIHWR